MTVDIKDIVSSYIIAFEPSEKEQEKAAARLEVCRDCEFLNKNRCTVCHCPVKIKVYSNSPRNMCPKQKWPDQTI